LRLWSAGCATGEEAYTLAMLVSDLLGDDIDNLNVRIFATDIAADAVDFARRGVYPASAAENLPSDLIERYFVPLDGAYEVRKSVRSLVIFGEHDLGYRAPFPRIDLVVCRNVLIYFTPELQRRALQLFAFSLRQGGYLALGKAETVSPLPEFFALEQPRLKVFRRVGEPAPIPATSLLDISPYAAGRSSRRTSPSRRVDLSPPPSRPRESAAGPLTPRMFERLPTGVVVVERNYHIRSINLAARRLLGIHSDPIGEDLIHRAPPALSAPLRVGLDAAFRGEATRSLHRFPEDVLDDGDRDLSLAFGPADGDDVDGVATTAVVVVNDVTDLAERLRQADTARARLATELERQSARTNEAVAEVRELRSANQSLALANARLRAENEELLVANEEAQAAAEEIETLNEELQATNEELETLNEELQATVEELTATNDELQARTIELQAAAREERPSRSAGATPAS
jgi:two-component system CheB/CheR fusion protein